MKKYGIAFDSSCGLTSEEAKNKKVGLVPLIIKVDGKVYKAGETILSKDLYKLMNKETEISTATPEGSDLIKVFDELLKENDEVIFIPISYKFSSTGNAARMIIDSNERFRNKVHVFERSVWSAPWTFLYMDEIINKSKTIQNHEELYTWLEGFKEHLIGFLSPSNLIWFVKGGRLSRKQYLLANAFRITPILTIKDGEINQESVIRTISSSKAMKKMISMFEPIYEKLKIANIKFKFVSLFGGDSEATSKLASMVASHYNIDIKDIITNCEISAEQASHMGPNAFGLTYKILS